MLRSWFVRTIEKHPRYWLPVGFGMFYLALMTIMRLTLTVWQWQNVDLAMLVPALLIGLVYDLAFYCYLLIPFVLYLWLMPDRVFRSRAGFGFSAIGLAVFIYLFSFIAVSEWLFWDEFKARFNFIAVDYLVYSREVIRNINESYAITPILIVIGVVTAGMVILQWKFLHLAHARPTRLATRTLPSLLLLALPVLVYTGLDQGLHQFSKNRIVNELAANGPYQFIAAFRNNRLEYTDYYRTLPEAQVATLLHDSLNTAEVNEWRNQSPVDTRRWIRGHTTEQPLNVVLVSVESLSADFLGAFGNQQGITPNLDKLAQSGMLFTQVYATGSRTDRGLEALTLSVPPTPGRSLVKRPEQYGRYSLGSEFEKRQYDTAFFYGGRGYFDNMNTFFSHLGYRIVDQTDLSADEVGFANAWGAADEYVFNRVLKEADQDHIQGKHFFFHFMTTSNHRPYTFPANRIDLPTGSRAAAVKYTDWAIGNFIEQAKTHAWFNNTVFVLVADHCADSAGERNLDARRHHIPLIVYSPAHIKPVRVEQFASQIDVAPTVYGLLNFTYESHFFGHDILHAGQAAPRAFIGNYQHLGLLTPQHLIYLKPRKGVGKISDPLGSKPQEENLTLQDETAVNNAIAYYQAADEVIQQHLLDWKPPQTLSRN